MINFFKSFFWLPALISLVVYLPILQFGTAWGDDQVVISPHAKNINLMLSSFYNNTPGLHFYPLYLLQSFLINYIFNVNAFPFGFHLYSLVLHVISCILAVIILYKITNSKLASILIVSLWTVHPLNVECLIRIGCGPAQVASGTFCLAFILCFLKVREINNPSKGLVFSISGIFFFLASLTSYEQYFFFPIVLALIFLYLEGKRIFKERSYLYQLIIPLGLMYPIYLLWKYFACGGTLFETSDELIKWTEMGSIKDVLFRALWLSPQLLVHYLKLLFWPSFLAESQADWYKVGGSIFSLYSLFCQVSIIVLILSAIVLYKKIPLFTIGIFWFLISMVLVIQIIPLFSIVDEHYCYISILGLFLSIFSLIKHYQGFIPPKILAVMFFLIFGILLWRTELYIPNGKSHLSNVTAMAKYSPDWNKIFYMTALKESIKSSNKEPSPLVSDEAYAIEFDKWYKKYLYVEPDLSYKFGPMQVYYNYLIYRGLGLYLYDSHRFEDLNILLGQALSIKNNAFGWFQNTKFLVEIGHWEEAWASLRRAIELDPTFKHSYGLMFIEIVEKANKLTEAENIIENYIKLKPKSSHPYLFSGLFYKSFGKEEKALSYFKEGIAKDKIVSLNDAGLYMVASDLFIKNQLLDLAKDALSIVIPFDPCPPKASQKLQEISSLEVKYTLK